MPVNPRPRIVSYALKTIAGMLACGVVLFPAAQAAGLGKLTVLSALGQPLQAEIELTAVASSEAGTLVAKLAPADAYRAANIEFNPTLLLLRFAVEQRGVRQFVRISSTQAVNEPFVDLLLELGWDSGRLVREYTFLLDPPEMRQTQPAQVAVPADVPAVAQSAPLRPERTAAPPASPAAEKARLVAQYSVKPGDTLGRIAARLKPAGVSLDLMLVALYRANPDAFSGENMNRLRSGRILALPDLSAIRGTASDPQAKGVVIAHAADFNAYRSKLAGQVALSAPARAAESSQSAAGKISAMVEEHPTAANESKDQLKLSKAAPPASAAGKTATAAAEDMVAKERQVADATARIKELEKNVSDLEHLMAVKARPLASAPVPVIDLNEARPVAPAPAKPAAPALKQAPLPEPGWLDTVTDNITAIGIALAALLAGAAALIVARRKKPRTPSKATAGVAGAPGAEAQPLFDESGGQSVDTNNSVFNSNFSPSASQLDTNEVDPVAEADVYIAYGRDAQAEEILKEALRSHPERHPVRVKLLEIYAARKDARAFETQAGELYSLTRGSGDEWAQVAAMGLSIDPQNRLYAAAVTLARELEPGAPAPTALSGLDMGLDMDMDLSPDAPLPADHQGIGTGPQPDLDMAALDVPELAAPKVVPPELAADNSLDFDLGGFSFEPVAPTVPEPAVAAAPLVDMDFDLPFDTASAVAVTAGDDGMDFDLPFDTEPAVAVTAGDYGMDFDLPGDAEPAVAVTADDDGMDFDLPGDTAPAVAVTADDDMDLGLPSQFAMKPAASAAAPLPAQLPDSLLDLDMMNFELEPAAAVAAVPGAPTAPAPAAPAPAVPEFDLSGIDLDLGMAELDGALGDDTLSASWMEMDTKLDLAVAYQEIGDKEGARELIDEVIKGGSAGQMAKARTIRAQLG